MTTEVKDYPFVEVADQVAALKVKHGDKFHFFQKFTCKGCGSRQTMDGLDKLYTSGICEECGYETNIAETGCNYMLWLHA